MAGSDDQEVEALAAKMGEGSIGGVALGELFSELRQMAGALMSGERVGHTLQPTALVNEAFVRLAPSRNLEGADRRRFLEAAAVAMRRVLVDHARRSKADKRGGAWERVTLQGLVEDTSEGVEFDVLALEEALAELEELDPRAAKVVELRFFAGFSGEEIAAHLDVSRNTVVRELTMARAWLRRALEQGGA